jgi:hypothetical protein
MRANVGHIPRTADGAVLQVRGKGDKDRCIAVEAPLVHDLTDDLDSRAAASRAPPKRRSPTGGLAGWRQDHPRHIAILGGTGVSAGRHRQRPGPRRSCMAYGTLATELANANALVAKIQPLPETVRRSLTWDQGPEMRDWKQVAIAADIAIFFCDPHKPWQRGSNENTNGLLRQYFPKGSDLSVHSEAELDQVAAELNDRPRKRYDYAKPNELISHLLQAG